MVCIAAASLTQVLHRLCYWSTHSLDLLGGLPSELGPRVVEWLKHLQVPTGGYGGGPMQVAHLAPTYAAVNALVIIGTPQAYASINRELMYKWLMSLKDPSGGFKMHEDGEVDIRGTYCALAVASLLNIKTPELLSGVPAFLAACQTYEGGMGGFPGNEAHGGYTFCGVAAAWLAEAETSINLRSLLHWVAHRQMWPDHGFQGRTNKLVDSCYSFWQAASMPILDMISKKLTGKHLGGADLVARWQLDAPEITEEEEEEEEEKDTGDWLFDQLALQQYLLLAAQEPKGLFRDKPGKSADPYHTCYSLSGLSVAQHNRASTTVHGAQSNLIAAVDPVHNIRREKVAHARAYFDLLPTPKS